MSSNGKSEAFRDSLSTIDDKGKRVWIYPKKPSGKLYNWRKIVSYFLLAFLFAGPWIKISGEPLLMLNVLERKYVFFGQVFWPQDFYIFLFGMLTLIVFIIVFTVVYGRLFCGWVCPQTIFMEMLFRRIEYWIEGDRNHQKKLDRAPWNREKILKKGAKHLIFFAISFAIANTFLAYLIGSDELLAIQFDNPANHIGGLSALLVFTFAFYGVFAKMREQVCTTVCPYGRLQGVLLDRNSMIVSYDYVRGENRSKFRKNEDRAAEGKGDCIDCHQCVDVCPTGIDIRNGTQLECVNCTACIDVCNSIMEKTGLEPNLIRYDSEEGVSSRDPWKLTTRAKAYTGVLVVLIGVFVTLLVTRTNVDTTLLRTPGTRYQEQQGSIISNMYNYKVVNKTGKAMPIELKLENLQGSVELASKTMSVEPQELAEGVLFVKLDRKDLDGTSTDIKIGVYSEGKRLETVSTTFIGPLVIK